MAKGEIEKVVEWLLSERGESLCRQRSEQDTGQSANFFKCTVYVFLYAKTVRAFFLGKHIR